jgi:class I fructose-bisphosphate aldolase
MMSIDKIRELLGDQADTLLNHTSTAITKDSLAILPSSDFVTESFTESNRSIQVMNSLQRLYGTGRLANTGYLSILPIDQVSSTVLVHLSHQTLCSSIQRTS